MLLSGELGEGGFGFFVLADVGPIPPPIPGPFTSLLPPGTSITAAVSPLYSSMQNQITLSMWCQDKIGTPFDIPGTVTMQIRLPDLTVQTFSLSSTIPIAHVTGSGTYVLTIGGGMCGTFSYAWFVNTQPIWNGLFYVIDKNLP